MDRFDRSSGEERVTIPVDPVSLDGGLIVPGGATGLVVFAHGSGSSRFSPRNRHVASILREAALATLLFDLLTAAEEVEDQRTRRLRFDIALLAHRLTGVTDWITARPDLKHLRIGYFGASTGAAAALIAAAERPDAVGAVVSRGGRPDLAGEALASVRAPTLLIVGGADLPVIDLNRKAMRGMSGPVQLEIVPGATHLFEEPGTLDTAARLARDWFARYLPAAGSGA
jgi:putative phosphoribosyl transferase